MSSYQSTDPNTEKGCIAVIGLIALGLVAQALIQLLHTILIVAAVGGIGFLIFRLLEYDKLTGNVTAFLERTFRVNELRKSQASDILPDKQETEKELPSPEPDILEQLNNLKSEVANLHTENEKLKTEQKKDIQEALVQLDRKNKSELLNDIFGQEPSMKYSRSDEFEKQEFQMGLKKKEEELQLKEIRHEVNAQLFEQDKKIIEYRYEAKKLF